MLVVHSVAKSRTRLEAAFSMHTSGYKKQIEKPGRLMATSTIQALGCISSGEQGSANTCPWAKYVQSPVFIHSVLLKQDHAYLFMAVFILGHSQ